MAVGNTTDCWSTEIVIWIKWLELALADVGSNVCPCDSSSRAVDWDDGLSTELVGQHVPEGVLDFV